jgi:ribosome maturation protein SDO1
MPVGINQPSNRISLTNISLVRLKKGKKRFELACYKNKLLEYRSGTETDLDNVLQVPTIFLNVSKGETAPNAELAKAWPPPKPAEHDSSTHVRGEKSAKGGKKGKRAAEKHDEEGDEQAWKDMIIREILQKGEIQVNASERKELLERMEREIVEEVAQRLVDPTTKRVYTTGMIRKGLDVLSKEGGHAPPQDSLSHKLAKVNLDSSEPKSPDSSTTKKQGSSDASGQATPTTDEDPSSPTNNGNKDKGKAKEKPDNMPMWTGVSTEKPVKSQALSAIRALIAWQPIPVMRARMRLRITCPTSIAKQAVKSSSSGGGGGEDKDHGTIKDKILSFVEVIESQNVLSKNNNNDEWEVVGFVEPGAFKTLGEFCAGETKGKGRVEVLDMAVTHTDE